MNTFRIKIKNIAQRIRTTEVCLGFLLYTGSDEMVKINSLIGPPITKVRISEVKYHSKDIHCNYRLKGDYLRLIRGSIFYSLFEEEEDGRGLVVDVNLDNIRDSLLAVGLLRVLEETHTTSMNWITQAVRLDIDPTVALIAIGSAVNGHGFLAGLVVDLREGSLAWTKIIGIADDSTPVSTAVYKIRTECIKEGLWIGDSSKVRSGEYPWTCYLEDRSDV